MIWLIASIILSTYVGIVFKVFEKFGIPNLQAIVVNYLVCVITGSVYLGFSPFTVTYFQKNYTPYAVLQGFFFFVVFHLISKCINQFGVSATSVANKLSLVIPVVMAYFLFADSISSIKIIGIVLAGLAVYLTSSKDADATATSKNILLPLLIFVGSGLLDTLTSYMQKKYLIATEDGNVYVIFCFASGFVFGGLFLLYQIIQGKQKFVAKSIIGGIVLGVPNYFSIYTFIKALDVQLMPVSALVPINNIGVVFASAICAVLFFKENLNAKNKIGLLVALLAIVVILFSDAKLVF
jgi:drug/metabolite transporter (DMT)-like permease